MTQESHGGVVTLNPEGLGRVVAAAAGTVAGEHHRAMTQAMQELKESTTGELNDLRLRVGVLGEAIGGIERHNGDRAQQLWEALYDIGKALQGVNLRLQRLEQGADSGQGDDGEDDKPRYQWLRKHNGDVTMTLPPGGEEAPVQDSAGSEAN